jgi:hypothetical protein
LLFGRHSCGLTASGLARDWRAPQFLLFASLPAGQDWEGATNLALSTLHCHLVDSQRKAPQNKQPESEWTGCRGDGTHGQTRRRPQTHGRWITGFWVCGTRLESCTLLLGSPQPRQSHRPLSLLCLQKEGIPPSPFPGLQGKGDSMGEAVLLPA